MGQAAQDSTLGPLLTEAGSDKGVWYGRLYDLLLEPLRDSVRCVIEIGIGTMIPDAPSSMVNWTTRSTYRPGNSLRVWRDYFPNAEVHGIDPAPDTVVAGEPRITTHLVDSRNVEQVGDLFERFHLEPDLVIDDGLHTAEAQIATLKNFLPRVRPGGLYVVEDIEPGKVRTVSSAIESVRPGCSFVPDARPEPWIALAIRTPR